jgi:two-component sensor histidine kinase
LGYLFVVTGFSQNKLANTFFVKAYDFKKIHQIDSAFFYYKKAQKLYENNNDSINLIKLGDVLINMSNIQFSQKDFIGNEINIIKALKIFKQLNDTSKIVTCYKKLGDNAKEQLLYDKSISYHKKALILGKKNYQIAALTNIGITYKDQNKFNLAIQYFNKALEFDDLANKYPIKYARLIDFIAYCNFKQKNYSNLPKDFYTALNLRKHEHHLKGVVSSNLHLAEFYMNQNKTSYAKDFLIEAFNISKQTKNNDGILTSLTFLAEVHPEKANYYFKTHKKLNDSIQKIQFKHKNYFGRIQYETEEKEQQIKIQKLMLSEKTRQQKMLILTLSIAIISLLLFIFLYKKIKAKNHQITNLQKEIHHRVKNNLAMINRFISVSRKKTKDKTTIENYNVLINRLESIKGIHELLYRTDLVGEINMQDFVQKIADLSSEAFKTDQNISVNVNTPILIDSKKAESVGIIINELITNAYKYAFNGEKDGLITIDSCIKDENILFSVSDNGLGFSEKIDINKTKSYGLKLVNGLTKQLSGTIKIISNHSGSTITIAIPK